MKRRRITAELTNSRPSTKSGQPHIPRATTTVRQPEETEGLRCIRFTPFFTLGSGKSPAAQKPGLLRMQFQLEPRESFAKLPKEPLCIGVMLEAEHEVVGIAHDDDIIVPIPLSPLLHSQVKRIVQADIGQQRRHRCPLR